MDNWTRRTRMIICSVVALPLAISMVIVGALSIERCSHELTVAESDGGNFSVANYSVTAGKLDEISFPL